MTPANRIVLKSQVPQYEHLRLSEATIIPHLQTDPVLIRYQDLHDDLDEQGKEWAERIGRAQAAVGDIDAKILDAEATVRALRRQRQVLVGAVSRERYGLSVVAQKKKKIDTRWLVRERQIIKKLVLGELRSLKTDTFRAAEPQPEEIPESAMPTFEEIFGDDIKEE